MMTSDRCSPPLACLLISCRWASLLDHICIWRGAFAKSNTHLCETRSELPDVMVPWNLANVLRNLVMFDVFRLFRAKRLVVCLLLARSFPVAGHS